MAKSLKIVCNDLETLTGEELLLLDVCLANLALYVDKRLANDDIVGQDMTYKRIPEIFKK